MLLRIKQTIILLLAATLLLTGSGFVLGKMICLKSGNVLLQFNGVSDNCCLPNQSDEAEISEKCCLTTNYTVATDNYVGIPHFELKPLPAITLHTNSFSNYITTTIVQGVNTFSDFHPPCKTGRSLRQFHQSFQI